MSSERLGCAGKKDSEKKSKGGETKEFSVVLFFVAISTSSGYDLSHPTAPTCPSFGSGEEMQRFMMHAHTCPTLAKMEARLELALSSTMRLDVDMDTVTIDDTLPDICTEGGGAVHTDGAGFISLDLARLCPSNLYRGTALKGADGRGSDEVHPPSQCLTPPQRGESDLRDAVECSGLPPAAPGARVSGRKRLEGRALCEPEAASEDHPAAPLHAQGAPSMLSQNNGLE